MDHSSSIEFPMIAPLIVFKTSYGFHVSWRPSDNVSSIACTCCGVIVDVIGKYPEIKLMTLSMLVTNVDEKICCHQHQSSIQNSLSVGKIIFILPTHCVQVHQFGSDSARATSRAARCQSTTTIICQTHRLSVWYFTCSCSAKFGSVKSWREKLNGTMLMTYEGPTIECPIWS